MGILGTLKNNKKRVLTGTIIGLIVLFCLARGGLPLLLLLFGVVFIAAKEYVEILKNKGFFPFFQVILAVATLLITATVIGADALIPIILAMGTIAAFLSVLFKGRQPYIANVATTILGFMLSWLPCYIVLIRQLNADDLGVLRWHFNDGMHYLIMLFFVILATDIGAYYFGSKYGKHKLSPVVSPKKSIEGSIAGAICALITALVIGKTINMYWYQSLIAGGLITTFAQLGDLSESLLKRDAGVKDSGNSLPGHGGFLDRADSYLFSAPVAYYYFKYFVASHYTYSDFVHYIKKVLDVIGL